MTSVRACVHPSRARQATLGTCSSSLQATELMHVPNCTWTEASLLCPSCQHSACGPQPCPASTLHCPAGGKPAEARGWCLQALSSQGVRVHNFEAFMAIGEARPVAEAACQRSDVCTIMYTSGTTGDPKVGPIPNTSLFSAQSWLASPHLWSLPSPTHLSTTAPVLHLRLQACSGDGWGQSVRARMQARPHEPETTMQPACQPWGMSDVPQACRGASQRSQDAAPLAFRPVHYHATTESLHLKPKLASNVEFFSALSSLFGPADSQTSHTCSLNLVASLRLQVEKCNLHGALHCMARCARQAFLLRTAQPLVDDATF